MEPVDPKVETKIVAARGRAGRSRLSRAESSKRERILKEAVAEARQHNRDQGVKDPDEHKL
jgi:hypothetical protein